MKLHLKTQSLYTKHPFVCLLVVNVLFMALAVNILPFSYEGNDDRFLSWNTSGYLNGYPRYYVFWMSVFYAWFESRLYLLLPQVEWHSWLFLAIHLVCLTIMGHCIIKTKHNRWAKGLILSMLYVLEMYNLIHFQFTTTAGLAAVAGMLLIVSKRSYMGGVVLFLLGVLIRYHAAMFCGLMTAALFPLIIARLGFEKKQLATLVICVVAAFGLHLADKYMYDKDSNLKEMRAYESLRGKVYDNSNNWRVYACPPKGLTRQEILGVTPCLPYISDSIWSQRDAELFISTEKMELFLQTVEDYTSYKGIPGVKKIKNIIVQLPQRWMLFAIGFLILAGCFVGCDSKKERLALLFGAVFFIMTTAFLTLDRYVNVRSFICGLFPLIWMPLYLIPYRKNVTNLFAALALLLTTLFFIKAMPPTKPSAIYRQQMELVKQGVEKGGKYLYTWEQIIPEVGYPFGLRLSGLAKIPPYAIGSVNEDMLDNGECLTLVGKKSSIEEIDTIKCQFADNLSVAVKAKELCRNEQYVLFRIVRNSKEAGY